MNQRYWVHVYGSVTPRATFEYDKTVWKWTLGKGRHILLTLKRGTGRLQRYVVTAVDQDQRSLLIREGRAWLRLVMDARQVLEERFGEKPQTEKKMVHTFEVRMLVQVEDTEGSNNTAAAKQRDLEHDLPRFVPYDLAEVTVSLVEKKDG